MPFANETELRQLIRGLLLELVAERKTAASTETVRIGSDADLQAFITKLAMPGIIEAVRAGKLHFALAGEETSVSGLPAGRLGGVVSEQTLARYEPGATIILTQDAVLTPLARDSIRRLGLKIERRDR